MQNYVFPVLPETYFLLRQQRVKESLYKKLNNNKENSASSLQTAQVKEVILSFAHCLQAGQKLILCYCKKP